MSKYEKMFVHGALKFPEKTKGPVLSVPMSYEGPKELILSGYCTPVENQGSLPYCAAYAASSFAENVLWRRRGYHRDVDPVPLYKFAKTIDGDPDGDGTLLECPLKGLVARKIFGDQCRPKLLKGQLWGVSGKDVVKYAVHKYGVCVAGFDITSEWFDPRRGVVSGDGDFKSEGGHAVVVCGFDEGGFLILNSWGKDYAHGGFVYIANKAFDDQFMYGACLTHVLDD